MPEDPDWTRERAQILREMIRHEDTLRDHRLGYLLTFNAFLFAALAFAWKSAVPLVFLLAGLGIAVGVSALAGQVTSNTAIRKIRHLADEDADPPVIGLTSEEKREENIESYELPWWAKAFAPWNAFPRLLITAWLTVIVVRVLVCWLR